MYIEVGKCSWLAEKWCPRHSSYSMVSSHIIYLFNWFITTIRFLTYYFVYCNYSALKKVNGACWCTSSLLALRVPGMCFWPAKTRRNLELFELLTCHWPGAQIRYRQKRRKLITASLLLHCIGWYSCLRSWNEFFSAVFQVLDWSFLVLHFDGRVCNWIP